MKLFRMSFRDLYLSILLAAVVAASLFATTTSAESLAERLSGKILLQVEKNGEAWYVYPETKERYFLGRPSDAYDVMRQLGLGISNADLSLIPEVGTNAKGNKALRQRLAGRILLQVESHGEAWYVHPDTQTREYLGRPEDAFKIMREHGLGIADLDLVSIPVASDSAPSNGVHGSEPDMAADLNDGLDGKRVALFNAINAERSRLSLSKYTLSHDLSQAAQAQADDMALKGYVDFVSPEGRRIDTFAVEAGYEARLLGQNIAQTNGDAAGIMSAWKDQGNTSYLNAISSQYEHVGIGMRTINGFDVYTVAFALSLESYFAQQTAGISDLDAVRDAMLERVNAERAQAGAAPLIISHLLNLAAQGHADDMYNRAYYAHESPEGTNALDRIRLTGYEPRIAAENIAKNQFSVKEVMDSWMASEGHRVNILDPELTEVGFGLSYGRTADGYAILWVQDFAQPE